ncbi:serine protease inhibitor 3/4-like [Bicyclus anynana]|uniref:Serine protease inhibitor 3/4-like n=1 Tax=Bicyclus anynana TaxID=110368 RepID=A0A6J1NN14_BICAN|nr:serine protease inhibitor 3/4-like [Bicyclus anynana]
MRVPIILIFFIAVSSGELDFYSKVRNFSTQLLYYTQLDTPADVDADFFISPYTVWYFLMIMVSETVGDTREQITRALSLDGRSDYMIEFRNLTRIIKSRTIFGNYLYYDVNLKVRPDGVNRLRDLGFFTERLNFKKPTFKEPIVPNIEDFVNSSIIMSNAIHFTASWKHSLKSNYSVIENGFFEAMYHVRAHFPSADFDFLKASVTELPYSNDKYSMLIIRPHSGYNVSQVYVKLKDVSLKDIVAKLEKDALEHGLVEVDVMLPSISANSHVIFNKPLENLGLLEIFNGNSANFYNLVEDDIYISEITQGVELTFTEEQTIVSATIPSKSGGQLDKWKKIVPLKKPFISFIMEKSTGTILFGGVHSNSLAVHSWYT